MSDRGIAVPENDLSEAENFVIVGRISGFHGVRGSVKIHSYTRPRENISHYNPWYVKVDGVWEPIACTALREHGRTLIAALEGYSDRDSVQGIFGCDIAINRSQLPPLPPDEWYWADLIGLEVKTTAGARLGVVTDMLETGSADVLVVEGDTRHLIPFVKGVYVDRLDWEDGTLIVDWD